MYRVLSPLTVTALLLALAPHVAAQEAPTAQPLDVGVMAPDFELTGATRFGILRDPVRLSDYHGKTVVLSFFFRARTRG
jgi:hypothetical protein